MKAEVSSTSSLCPDQLLAQAHFFSFSVRKTSPRHEAAQINLVSRFRIRTVMPQFPHLFARCGLLLSTGSTCFTLYCMLNYVKIIFT